MLRLNDWFCGAGGATQGAHSVPGVEPVLAANHDQLAIDTHSTNFPDVEHFRGEIKDLDVAGHPYAEIFWASPECTNWSQAKGKAVDFDKHPALFGDPVIEDKVIRSRALMQDVIRYLRGMDLRQRPVLAGVVENVVDIRKWDQWSQWLGAIESLGYRTRLIALNSMHAESQWTPRAPQSRDRLYLAYWHQKLGRDPDWEKWLRPSAWCPTCEQMVSAVQVFKKRTDDMGRYRAQYVYRCPRVQCRNRIVEPSFVPAAAAIDWGLPGTRIGDKPLKEFFADKEKTESLGWHPLAPKTLARIEAGIRKYARPIHLEAAGNTYGRRPGVRSWPMDEPLKTVHTSVSKALAVPPMLVPVEGREGKQASTVESYLRAQTARNETGIAIPPLVMRNNSSKGDGAEMLTPVGEAMRTLTTMGHQSLVVPPMVVRGENRESGAKPVDAAIGAITAAGSQFLAVPPFLTTLRGGGSREAAYEVDQALATVSAGGNHHGLVTMRQWAALYAYDSGEMVDHRARPMPTQTTLVGDALLGGYDLPAVEDCLFRMLEPHEIHAGMAFIPSYVVLGNKRQQVRQLGNAVTPPVSEVLVSALVECISGEQLERAA